VGDLNTPLSPKGHSNKKINKEILKLNDRIDQKDFTDDYKIFHPATAQLYILLSNPWNLIQNRTQNKSQ
jgi:hypothetical protein